MGLLHLKDAVQPHPLKEVIVERVSHVESVRIPPSTSAVHRTLPCSLGGYAPFDQVPFARPRVFPRNPNEFAQVPSDMDVELLKGALAFVESEVLPPPPQNRIQFCDGCAQGGSPRLEEDVLQFLSESFEAFGVYAGCPRCADEGVAEKFRPVSMKRRLLGPPSLAIEVLRAAKIDLLSVQRKQLVSTLRF